MLKMKKICGLMIVLLLVAGLTGCGEEEVTFSETIAAATEIIELHLELTVPGLAIAIIDVENDFTWATGFGYADTINERLVTADTIFPLMSIYRVNVAITVMQLVEQGLIDLDAPITTYLPNFSMIGNYQDITVRKLLTHTAGLAMDYSIWHNIDDEDLGFGDFSFYDRYFLERLSTQTLQYEPGTSSGYSLIGAELAILVIAAVTGYENSYEAYMNRAWENIHSRLGMTDSYRPVSEALLPYYAMPYSGRTIQRTLEFALGSEQPIGSASANDMALFMHAILNDTRDGTELLLTQDSFLQMFDFKDFTINVGGPRQVGLGFLHRIDVESDLSFIGHSGGYQTFYYAEMVFNIESGIGVFVATNGASGGAITPRIAQDVLRSAIEEKSGN